MHGDIERLAADELEKIDRHLIALEELRDDPTFVTLRQARLTGVTKRRWDAASAAVMSATSRLGKSRDTVSEAIRLLREAWHSFAMIRDLLPGELAPKLALAVCAELLDTPAVARHYYQTVWRTGQGFVGAAFGVARTYAKEPGSGGTEDAIDVLESIPESLRHHATARIKALELRLGRSGLDERGLRRPRSGCGNSIWTTSRACGSGSRYGRPRGPGWDAAAIRPRAIRCSTSP